MKLLAASILVLAVSIVAAALIVSHHRNESKQPSMGGTPFPTYSK